MTDIRKAAREQEARVRSVRALVRKLKAARLALPDDLRDAIRLSAHVLASDANFERFTLQAMAWLRAEGKPC